MARRSSRPGPRPSIPVVDFYGESTGWPVADLIHCELLQMRSARHNWEIKPHRHHGLLQIFYLREGSGQAQVDSTDIVIKAPSVLVVPEMCVHKFMWEVDSRGYVLFIARPLLNRLNTLLGGQDWGGGAPAVHGAGGELDFVDFCFETIAAEYRQHLRNRELMLESLLGGLCVWLSRQQAGAEAAPPGRSKPQEHFRRFQDLLEANYCRHHEVAWYAQELGISAPHLNAICRRQRQKSALDVIHERLLLEAQRALIYTSRPAAEIATQLGFSEPSYFSRFFKRKTGASPKAFRQQSLTG